MRYLPLLGYSFLSPRGLGLGQARLPVLGCPALTSESLPCQSRRCSSPAASRVGSWVLQIPRINEVHKGVCVEYVLLSFPVTW